MDFMHGVYTHTLRNIKREGVIYYTNFWNRSLAHKEILGISPSVPIPICTLKSPGIHIKSQFLGCTPSVLNHTSDTMPRNPHMFKTWGW